VNGMCRGDTSVVARSPMISTSVIRAKLGAAELATNNKTSLNGVSFELRASSICQAVCSSQNYLSSAFIF